MATTRIRIYSNTCDVEIEGDDLQDCMEQFLRDYPSEIDNSVHIEWLQGDMQQLDALIRTKEALDGLDLDTP